MAEDWMKKLEFGAQCLATVELKSRLAEAEEVPACLKEVEAYKEAVDEIRRQIPETEGKEYWWDVPFSLEGLKEEDDAFFFENGWYIEAGTWEKDVNGIDLIMKTKTNQEPVMNILSQYQYYNLAYTVLVMDKKKMRKYVKFPAEIKTIYQVQWMESSRSFISQVNDDGGYRQYILDSFHQDMEQIEQRYEERMALHEERWDKYEIISNAWNENLAMTDQEKWMLGYSSYANISERQTWRDWYGTDIGTDMVKKKQQRRIQLADQMREYHALFQKTEKNAALSDYRIHFMPVGEAVYCGGELAALIAYRKQMPVYECLCKEDFNPDKLEGKIWSVEMLFKKRPAQLPLYQHFIVRYGDELPVYNVLEQRPMNCPDVPWRMWAELRWMHLFNRLRAMNQE